METEAGSTPASAAAVLMMAARSASVNTVGPARLTVAVRVCVAAG